MTDMRRTWTCKGTATDARQSAGGRRPPRRVKTLGMPQTGCPGESPAVQGMSHGAAAAIAVSDLQLTTPVPLPASALAYFPKPRRALVVCRGGNSMLCHGKIRLRFWPQTPEDH